MRISLGNEEGIAEYTTRQLNTYFPDNNTVKKIMLQKYMGNILSRLEICFSKVNNLYFNDGVQVHFNHLNGDQWSMFLYMASRTLYEAKEDRNICDKLFQLNRTIHGIDAYYEVELPSIFLFVHPLGTVLGRGKYSDYFVVYQRCNVGSNHGNYPTIGRYVTLHPGAAVLGQCKIGECSKISTGSLLLDKDLEENSLYIGQPLDYVIKYSDKRNEIWV